MREIKSEELRELQMQILDYVDAFCRQNNVKYTISGGTLLGAVRHGGFIPWDDDIDIQMLRNEYNRFTELWNKHENSSPYELVNIESGNSMGYAMGKVYITNTYTIVRGIKRVGVFIDIFPLDKVMNDDDFNYRHGYIKKLHRQQVILGTLNSKAKINIFRRILLYCQKPKKSYNQLAEEINNIAMKHNNECCPLVFEMVSGFICKNPMPIEIFDEYHSINFENRIYQAIADYDTYLSLTFGDYMQLPPEEKRKSHHSFKAFWADVTP